MAKPTHARVPTAPAKDVSDDGLVSPERLDVERQGEEDAICGRHAPGTRGTRTARRTPFPEEGATIVTLQCLSFVRRSRRKDGSEWTKLCNARYWIDSTAGWQRQSQLARPRSARAKSDKRGPTVKETRKNKRTAFLSCRSYTVWLQVRVLPGPPMRLMSLGLGRLNRFSRHVLRDHGGSTRARTWDPRTQF